MTMTVTHALRAVFGALLLALGLFLLFAGGFTAVAPYLSDTSELNNEDMVKGTLLFMSLIYIIPGAIISGIGVLLMKK